jgi:hypothetical protein
MGYVLTDKLEHNTISQNKNLKDKLSLSAEKWRLRTQEESKKKLYLSY